MTWKGTTITRTPRSATKLLPLPTPRVDKGRMRVGHLRFRRDRRGGHACEVTIKGGQSRQRVRELDGAPVCSQFSKYFEKSRSKAR